MFEKSNTWPEQVLDTLNSCWRALLESLSNTQANVRRLSLPTSIPIGLDRSSILWGLWQSFAIACPLPGATAVSLRFRSNPRPVSGLPDVIVLDRESPRLLPRSQTGSPS